MADATRYHFITHWIIPAAQERVWQELMRPDEWPLWWRGVERVELLAPGRDALGHRAVRRYTWRGRLPYRLTFIMETTSVQPQTRIEGRATGELEGVGCWHLEHDGKATHARYDWQVTMNKRWMKLLAPVARPIFAWNHDVVMRWGWQGLMRRVAA